MRKISPSLFPKKIGAKLRGSQDGGSHNPTSVLYLMYVQSPFKRLVLGWVNSPTAARGSQDAGSRNLGQVQALLRDSVYVFYSGNHKQGLLRS